MTLIDYLHESDSGWLLSEALTAKVKTIFTDETGLVGAQSAGYPPVSIVYPVGDKFLLTTVGYPFQTSWDEKTKPSRASFSFQNKQL